MDCFFKPMSRNFDEWTSIFYAGKFPPAWTLETGSGGCAGLPGLHLDENTVVTSFLILK
jgi:hypothetical protein